MLLATGVQQKNSISKLKRTGFAIALMLHQAAQAIGNLGFGAEQAPGPLEKLAMETGNIHEALSSIAEAVERYTKNSDKAETA